MAKAPFVKSNLENPRTSVELYTYVHYRASGHHGLLIRAIPFRGIIKSIQIHKEV